VIKKEETEVVYGVSSLSKDKAGAERLLELNRGHWEIENRLFWVRDVTFDEDRSRVRKKNGTEIMSSLRNLAISLIRIKRDFRYIPSALRHFSMHIDKAMMLLGI
jgi:predicted transposase YbfD/YdcC